MRYNKMLYLMIGTMLMLTSLKLTVDQDEVLANDLFNVTHRAEIGSDHRLQLNDVAVNLLEEEDSSSQ